VPKGPLGLVQRKYDNISPSKLKRFLLSGRDSLKRNKTMFTALCAKGPFGTCPRPPFGQKIVPKVPLGLVQGLPLGRKLSQFFLFFLFGPGYFNYDNHRLWVILIMGRKNYRTLCQRAQSRVVPLKKPVRDLSKGKFFQENLYLLATARPPTGKTTALCAKGPKVGSCLLKNP
jgi:hypothetical protein